MQKTTNELMKQYFVNTIKSLCCRQRNIALKMLLMLSAFRMKNIFQSVLHKYRIYMATINTIWNIIYLK